MNIVRYHQPASLVRELQQELFPLMSWFTESPSACQELATWTPRVDIKQLEDKYIALVDVPGIDPQHIDIEVEDNTLTIKGERKGEQEEKKENYYRVERFVGKFSRQIALPESINVDQIKARAKQGVLEIELPKMNGPKQQRKITVKEEK